MEGFMTVNQAADRAQLSVSHVRQLCIKGKLLGAHKMGMQWVIPEQSIDNYKPGPRGFGAKQAQMRAEAEKALAEQNAAIREAKGLPAIDSEASAAPEEPMEYVNVEEAAKILNRSKRTVRGYCSSLRIAGARKKDARGREWVIPKSSLKNVLPSIGVIRSDGTVMPLGKDKA